MILKEKRFLSKFSVVLFSIVILGAISIYDSEADSGIPEQIKELVRSWSDNKISNEDFAEAITFLVKNDLLKLPEMELLINENQKLKQDMNSLKSQLSEYEKFLHTEEKPKIKVHTNKHLYGPGDDIIIFGTVTSLVEGHSVGIVISDSSGKILAIAKIPPNSDKAYGFVAKSSIFKQSGDYSVNVFYGGVAYDHVEYSYRPIELRE